MPPRLPLRGAFAAGRKMLPQATRPPQGFSSRRAAALQLSSAMAAICLVSSSAAPAFVHSTRPQLLGTAPAIRAAGEIDRNPLHRVWNGLLRGMGGRVKRMRPVLGLRGLYGTAVTYEKMPSPSITAGVPPDTLLEKHGKFVSGVLPNGMRYCIFQNRKPESRFYANLEVSAGSVDEEESERGIAHYLEHCIFLGTEKYESNEEMKRLFTRLGMAFNADANAYTDFRSTVYTLSAPVRGKAKKVEEGGGAALFGGSGPMTTAGSVTQEKEEEGGEGGGAADALGEDSDNVEVVLDLLHQMMFKARIQEKDVDSERGVILSELRDRNGIGQRVVMEYYTFVHGDTVLPSRFPIGLEDLIKKFTADEVRAFYKKHYRADNMCLYICGDVDPAKVQESITCVFGAEPAHAPVPPHGPEPALWPTRGKWIEHDWEAAARGEKLHVTSHELITDFSLAVGTKEPFSCTRTVGDMRESLTDSLISLVMELRIRALRLAAHEPEFQGISWSYSASARSGCSQNKMSVSAQPKYWKQAVGIAAREAKRMEQYGVTAGELELVKTTFINSMMQEAQLKESLQSSTWMRNMMNAVQEGDQMMDPEAKAATINKLLEELEHDEINARAARLFHGMTGFLEADSPSVAFVSMPAGDEAMADFSEEELRRIIAEGIKDVAPPEDISVPAELISHGELAALRATENPTVTERSTDEATTVTQGRLSNGLRFTHRRNSNRPNEVSMHLTATGGRSLETKEMQGAAIAGSAAWLNGGCGGHAPSVISRFLTMFDISHDASCGGEGLTLDMLIATSAPGALRRAFSLVRLLLESPDFDERALERFKQRVAVGNKALGKSVDRLVSQSFFEQMFDEESAWRWKELQPEIVDTFTVEQVKELITSQLNPENLELVISGDFDVDELEDNILTYFGTLKSKAEGGVRPWEKGDHFKMKFKGGCSDRRDISVVDDVVRTSVLMGFPTISRWGKLANCPGVNIDCSGLKGPGTLADGTPYDNKMHVNRCLAIAAEMMNVVLFNELRNKRGLVYGISFGYRPFKLSESGFCTISFQPKNEQVEESVESVKSTLKQIIAEGFSEADFEGARQPLITRCREADVSNSFWLLLMEHLQNELSPKDISSIKKVPEHYEVITLDMVNEAVKTCYGHSLDNMAFTMGRSGPKEEDGAPKSE